jgi:hypothetical protein
VFDFLQNNQLKPHSFMMMCSIVYRLAQQISFSERPASHHRFASGEPAAANQKSWEQNYCRYRFFDFLPNSRQGQAARQNSAESGTTPLSSRPSNASHRMVLLPRLKEGFAHGSKTGIGCYCCCFDGRDLVS